MIWVWGMLLLCGTFFLGYRAGLYRHSTLIEDTLTENDAVSDLENQPQMALGVTWFVTLDCRACSKLNRVSWDNLKKKPLCGGCKQRLMPKRTIEFSAKISVQTPSAAIEAVVLQAHE